MKPRREFSFDGFGINGPDEYRSRLATFTPAGHDYPGLGPLLEAAPAMLEALRSIVAFADQEGGQIRKIHRVDVDNARAILQRLENLK